MSTTHVQEMLILISEGVIDLVLLWSTIDLIIHTQS